ncbi:hypothetical protein G7046_g448 [Stylonectria norvegica]|nr:hypothetical protein G7046_g448 [Stylonectria norvegica]
MAFVSDNEEFGLFVSDDDDELIEVLADRSAAFVNPGHLILPRPEHSISQEPRPASSLSHHHTRSGRRVERPPFFPARQTPARQQGAAVIDLTEEPDSPNQERRSRSTGQSQGQTGRNPRRTHSQRISPPRLERSDSTFMGRPTSIIDLTSDSPEEQRRFDPPNRGNIHAPRANPPPLPYPAHAHAHAHAHSRNAHADELMDIQFIESVPRRHLAMGLGFGRRLAGLLGAAELMGFNTPAHLDVSMNAFAPRESSPKPPMEPAPPTREGFTRDTCTDPEKEGESVVICPACSEELAYDPTGTVVSSSVGSSGKKRKRSPGEHHFWALKKCGHVYCADCFENRKPTKANRDGVGFRGPDGKAPSITPNEIRCAVEGCETKVASKTEWRDVQRRWEALALYDKGTERDRHHKAAGWVAFDEGKRLWSLRA